MLSDDAVAEFLFEFVPIPLGHIHVYEVRYALSSLQFFDAMLCCRDNNIAVINTILGIEAHVVVVVFLGCPHFA